MTKKKLRTDPVLMPLLELFATVDDVFTEPEALSSTNVYKTAGRIYREWKLCRAALDSDFDPKRYEQEMKREPKLTPLGRKQLASVSQTPSTDPLSISEKSRKQNAKREKTTASPSARRARSSNRASGSR